MFSPALARKRSLARRKVRILHTAILIILINPYKPRNTEHKSDTNLVASGIAKNHAIDPALLDKGNTATI